MDVRAWCQRSLVGADTREACDDASFGVPASIHPRGARRRRRVEARIEQQVRSEVLSRGLGSFSSRQLSQLLWANALADTTANDLLVALRHELLVVRAGRLDDFADVALVHVAWALARLLGQPSQLGADIVLGIGEELARRSLHSLHSRHVSTLLWAMARLGADSLEVFDAAEAWLASTDLCGLSEQSLVMVIWAMTTVSRASSESLVRVCMSVCVRAPMCVFQVRAHTHARMHARTHARTHTHTGSRRGRNAAPGPRQLPAAGAQCRRVCLFHDAAPAHGRTLDRADMGRHRRRGSAAHVSTHGLARGVGPARDGRAGFRGAWGWGWGGCERRGWGGGALRG